METEFTWLSREDLSSVSYLNAHAGDSRSSFRCELSSGRELSSTSHLKRKYDQPQHAHLGLPRRLEKSRGKPPDPYLAVSFCPAISGRVSGSARLALCFPLDSRVPRRSQEHPQPLGDGQDVASESRHRRTPSTASNMIEEKSVVSFPSRGQYESVLFDRLRNLNSVRRLRSSWSRLPPWTVGDPAEAAPGWPAPR